MRQVSLLFLVLCVASFTAISAQPPGQFFTVIDAGILVAESDGVADIIDTFSLTERDNGTIKLISSYIDNDHEVKSHDMTLNTEFQPVHYTWSQTSPVECEITVDVQFVDNRAIVSLTSPEGFEQQTFTTETEFLIFDGSAVDQLVGLLHRFWASGEDELQFDVLFAGNLEVLPSKLRYFGELLISTESETLTVEEYAWDTADGNRLLRILALDGRFLGGLQLGGDGLEDVLYRADLYPNGFEVLRDE